MSFINRDHSPPIGISRNYSQVSVDRRHPGVVISDYGHGKHATPKEQALFQDQTSLLPTMASHHRPTPLAANSPMQRDHSSAQLDMIYSPDDQNHDVFNFKHSNYSMSTNIGRRKNKQNIDVDDFGAGGEPLDPQSTAILLQDQSVEHSNFRIARAVHIYRNKRNSFIPQTTSGERNSKNKVIKAVAEHSTNYFKARALSVQAKKVPPFSSKQLGYEPVDNERTITKLGENDYVLHKLDPIGNSKQLQRDVDVIRIKKPNVFRAVNQHMARESKMKREKQKGGFAGVLHQTVPTSPRDVRRDPPSGLRIPLPTKSPVKEGRATSDSFKHLSTPASNRFFPESSPHTYR